MRVIAKIKNEHDWHGSAILTGLIVNSKHFFYSILIRSIVEKGFSSGSGEGGAEGAMPPSPVEISHKKDGRQRRHLDFMFLAPSHPAVGSDAGI